MNDENTILIVEDNPDIESTRLAFKQSGCSGSLNVVRDGAGPSTQPIPVVIRTSSAGEQEIIGGYDPGCSSFIRKQANSSRFAAAIRMLVHYRTLVDESPGLGRAA